MFSEHGLGAVVLTMEPSRYEYCEGTERSDDLRQVLEAGPGLLTRQTMLRTPFIWIHVKQTSYWRRQRLSHSHRSLMDRLRGRNKKKSSNVADCALFRSRFSAECHGWLNKPLPPHRQRLVDNLLVLATHLTKSMFVLLLI